MTPFGQQLAEFEVWAAINEPAAAPYVSAIIDQYYRGKGFSGLGDDVSDLLNSDPSVTGGATSAAIDTSNLLGSLVSTAGNLFNNQITANQKIQQLQAAAQVQQVQAAGAAANTNTMLMVGGVVAAVIVVALLTQSRR